MAALALKYRPQTFSELVGQLHAAQSLKNAIEFNKIGHAYLFHGSRGLGKTSMARILAKALNCVSGPTSTPCGTCEHCKEITSGNSLDVIEMDAASNRGIDHIRDLRENTRFAPMRCRYKIYIIDEVHMLTIDSFNALLKTLEEPPAHVVFILATTELQKIPETILSRCQVFSFKKFTIEELSSRLSYILKNENLAFDDDALLPIANKAEGSMRDALSLLDQVVAYTGSNKITLEQVGLVLGLVSSTTCLAFIDAIRTREITTQLKIIHELSNEGHDLKRFLWNCLAWLKDLSLAHYGLELPGLSDSLRHQLVEAAGGWQRSELAATFEILFQLYSNWGLFPSSKSSETRISLEMTLLDLKEKLEAPSVSSLVKKLGSLAQAIETGREFLDTSVPETAPQAKTTPETVPETVSDEKKNTETEIATATQAQIDIDRVIAEEFLIDRSNIPPEEQLFKE